MLPPEWVFSIIPKDAQQSYPAEKYTMEFLGPCTSDMTSPPTSLEEGLAYGLFRQATTNMGDIEVEISHGSLKKDTWLWEITQGRIGVDGINWASNEWSVGFHTDGMEETREVCVRLGIDPDREWGGNGSSGDY